MIKWWIKFITLLVLIIWIFSCTTPITKEYHGMGLFYWIDMPASDLIDKWGPPQNTYPLDDGGKIIEYVKESQMLIPPKDCVTIPRGPFEHHFHNDCENAFLEKSISVTKTKYFVDPNGIIYSYRWEYEPRKKTSSEY